MMEKNRVFISYSRKNESTLIKIVRLLESTGNYDIWYDEKLCGGSRVEEAIADRIAEQTEYFILLISPHSMKSRWVYNELSMADAKNVRIIPVLLKKTKIPNKHFMIIHDLNYVFWYQRTSDEQFLRALESAIKDENIDFQEKRKGRGKIAALIISGLSVSFAIIAALFLRFFGKTKVPDFRNMTYESAQILAGEKELTLRMSGEEYSDSIVQGEIMSQDIENGTYVLKETEIAVVISKGREVKVPNLSGLSEQMALEALDQEGLMGKAGTAVYTDSQKEGHVVSQEPQKNEVVEEGTCVTYVLSLGIETAKVPYVLGLRYEKAVMRILDAKLSMSFEEVYDNETEAGCVISQSMEPGTETELYQEIHLVISKGEPPKPSAKQTISSKKQSTAQDVSTPTEEEQPQSTEATAAVQETSGGSTPVQETSGTDTPDRDTPVQGSSGGQIDLEWDLVN